MQKFSKLTLIIFLITTIALICCIAIYIFLKDPLQIWHKNFIGKTKYAHARLAIKAFIRDYDFDSVIVGNSHSENTSSKNASKLLGGKFFNLSISGSTMYEKKMILNYLFKYRDIKKVIYIIDSHYLNLENEHESYPISTYGFLYNDNPIDDYKIYLNDKFMPCALGFTKCTNSIKDIDRPYAWFEDEIHARRFGGFDKWLKYKDDSQISANFKTILDIAKQIPEISIDEEYKRSLHKYLDENLLEVVASNPKVEFYIIIPPVSDLSLAISIRSDVFYKEEALLRYLVENENKYPNMKIFAFENLKEITNIKNYKDLTHYTADTNDFILESLRKNEHLINKNNVNQYINAVYRKAISVDLSYYQNLVKRRLNK